MSFSGSTVMLTSLIPLISRASSPCWSFFTFCIKSGQIEGHRVKKKLAMYTCPARSALPYGFPVASVSVNAGSCASTGGGSGSCRSSGRSKVSVTIPAKKAMSEYFRENFYITTSGNFRTQSLIDAILELGSDRILFSSDFPFDEMSDAAIWFDSASISEPDRLKIGRTNAIDLFKLKL